MATKAERIIELESEIAQITLAMTHILKGGQSYTINTASGAGTSRTVTMADYKMLSGERDKLRAELATLQCKRAVKLTSGW